MTASNPVIPRAYPKALRRVCRGFSPAIVGWLDLMIIYGDLRDHLWKKPGENRTRTIYSLVIIYGP
jgi:hypothetical protein